MSAQPTLDDRTVLLSVRSQYANLIVDGIKKVELRRRFPIDLKSGTRCLIYSSSPVQRIIGECKIGTVHKLSIPALWKEAAIDAMVGWEYYQQYFSGSDAGYAVHVYGHVRYDDPVHLHEVLGVNGRAPQSYQYLAKTAAPDL